MSKDQYTALLLRIEALEDEIERNAQVQRELADVLRGLAAILKYRNES